MNLYYTYSGLKSVYAKRFNRTLREVMYRYFTEHNTDYYLDVLDDMIDEYNHRKHSSIKATPYSVYMENVKPFQKEYKHISEPSFKVGDFVRVSKFKKTFEKGYTARWSPEVFKVVDVDNSSMPIMYQLDDLNGEEVTGLFYGEEMQKTDLKDFAVVDNIIEEKKVKGKKMFLVKYDGYDDSFNQWIDGERLEMIR